MKSEKSKSYCIALSGILSAICVIAMFCTGIIPIGAYVLPAFAGIVIWIIYREINTKWALLCFSCVSLLSILLTPDIEAKLILAGFFGYYPTIRDKITALKPKLFSIAMRFVVFNIPTIIIFAFLINVLGMGEILEDFAGLGSFAILGLWLLGNFTFLCYDVCLNQLSYFYNRWLRKKIKRIIK